MSPETLVTSAIVRDVVRHLNTGSHVFVSGAVDDLVLLRGQPMSLREALAAIAESSYDTGLFLDAVTGLRNGDETEVGGVIGTNHVTALTEALVANDQSVLVVIDQFENLFFEPGMSEADRERLARLQAGLRNAATVGKFRNAAVILSTSSPPSALLNGVELFTTVEFRDPSRAERRAVVDHAIASSSSHALDDAGRELVTKTTEGDSLRTVSALMDAVAQEYEVSGDLQAFVQRFRRGDRPDYWSHLVPRIPEIQKTLDARILGQLGAVGATLSVLSGRGMGLETGSKRRGGAEGQPALALLVGPTGVGKTELAKTLAEIVFGDPESYTRIDMSALAQAHSAERLTGASPSYVGYEAGGELTNAVLARPNSVILLDEIEKAHIKVLLRLMSILDDGRVADGQGRVAYFGDAIVLLTSNIGAAEMAAAHDLGTAKVAQVGREAVERYFVDHDCPELFGRLEHNIVPFDVLRQDIAPKIATKVASEIGFSNGPALRVDLESVQRFAEAAFARPETRAYGGLSIKNRILNDFRQLDAWPALNGDTKDHTVELR